jgi:Protein of unknown function (DUF3592)
MAKALPLILVGLAIVYGGGVELVSWFRSRARLRTVTGVVVRHARPGPVGPANLSRSAIVQFTAEDGRVVEVVSSAWSYPPPQVGQRLPVLYDPADPEGSADRAGVRTFKVVVSPVLIAIGVGFIVFGTTFL